MAMVNPVGMGNKTSRQFHRVAKDIRNFANSVYEYKASSSDDQWYEYYGSGKYGDDKYIEQIYPTQAPAVNKKKVPKRAPVTAGRRDRLKSR